MREGRIYSGGSASMIEKLFQCDSDDVMYIGPPPFSFSLSHTRMTSDSLSERASECFPHWHTFPRCRQQVRYDQYIQLLHEHTFPRRRRVHLRNRLRIGVRVSEIAYSRRICPGLRKAQNTGCGGPSVAGFRALADARQPGACSCSLGLRLMTLTRHSDKKLDLDKGFG